MFMFIQRKIIKKIKGYKNITCENIGLEKFQELLISFIIIIN